MPRQRPVARWQERAAAARTPQEQFTVACDRFRSALARLQRPQRDRGERTAASAEAGHLAAEAAGFLNELCERAERM